MIDDPLSTRPEWGLPAKLTKVLIEEQSKSDLEDGNAFLNLLACRMSSGMLQLPAKFQQLSLLTKNCESTILVGSGSIVGTQKARMVVFRVRARLC